jgi:cytoskeletal protein RodZ
MRTHRKAVAWVIVAALTTICNSYLSFAAEKTADQDETSTKSSEKKKKKAKAKDDAAQSSASASSTAAANTPSTGKAKPKTVAANSTPAASDPEIASAKAKGLVWVNADSGLYHKNGRWYGKTKQGKFMSEADAQKAGYKAAKGGS